MVTLPKLTEILQTLLNNASNNSGLSFKLFADTGEYEKTVREINKITRTINGLCSVIGSETMSNNGKIPVTAITVKTELIAYCENFDEDEILFFSDGEEETQKGNQSLMARVRNILDGICVRPSSDTVIESGKNYRVAYEFSLSNTGTREARIQVGDSITFAFNAYFYVIENGDNSLDHTFYLDGYEIPYLTAVPVRNTTIESDVYSSDTEAKGTSLGNSFSVKFTIPAFTTPLMDILYEYLWEGVDDTHILLQVNSSGDVDHRVKLCLISSVEKAYAGISNGLYNVTLTISTDNYEMISFPDNFYSKQLWQVIAAENALNQNTHRIYFPYDYTKYGVLLIFDSNGELVQVIDKYGIAVIEIDEIKYNVFVYTDDQGQDHRDIPFPGDNIELGNVNYLGGGYYVVSNVPLYFDLEEENG